MRRATRLCRTGSLAAIAMIASGLCAPAGYAQDDSSAVVQAADPAAAPPRRVLPKKKGEISFDDLKFDLEKGDPFQREMLPESIVKLNDQPVRLRGFILPTSVYQQSGIRQFVLVRDNQECCFGPGAALYDCVMVYMAEGASAEFSTRPVTVSGKFRVEELKYPEGDGHLAIYRIDAKEVK